MRGKSRTCREALFHFFFGSPTPALAVRDRRILENALRQVADLPRIGVAEPERKPLVHLLSLQSFLRLAAHRSGRANTRRLYGGPRASKVLRQDRTPRLQLKVLTITKSPAGRVMDSRPRTGLITCWNS